MQRFVRGVTPARSPSHAPQSSSSSSAAELSVNVGAAPSVEERAAPEPRREEVVVPAPSSLGAKVSDRSTIGRGRGVAATPPHSSPSSPSCHHSARSISTSSNGSARTFSSPPKMPSWSHLPETRRQTSSSLRSGRTHGPPGSGAAPGVSSYREAGTGARRSTKAAVEHLRIPEILRHSLMASSRGTRVHRGPVHVDRFSRTTVPSLRRCEQGRCRFRSEFGSHRDPA